MRAPKNSPDTSRACASLSGVFVGALCFLLSMCIGFHSHAAQADLGTANWWLSFVMSGVVSLCVFLALTLPTGS
jgi:hypothetical protein